MPNVTAQVISTDPSLSRPIGVLYNMQFIPFSALTLLALGLLIPEAAANSEFASSCNTYAVFQPIGNSHFYSLHANRRQPSGVYTVDVFLNLDVCFGNSGGNVVPQLQ
jgi:hypothetical protein